MDDFDDLDRTATHVSNDHRSTHDTEAPTLYDGRAPTRTTFYPDDEKYRRLRQYNDGIGDPDRDIKTQWADVQRDCKTAASILDCPTPAERHARELLQTAHEAADNGLRSIGHGRVESVVCGALKLAAAHHETVLTADDFAPLLSSWDIDHDAVVAAKNDLRQYTHGGN